MLQLEHLLELSSDEVFVRPDICFSKREIGVSWRPCVGFCEGTAQEASDGAAGILIVGVPGLLVALFVPSTCDKRFD